MTRPYTFHIGASWAGKAPDSVELQKVPFPSDGLIGAWRDKTLAQGQAARGRDAGEDFFFVQEVCISHFDQPCLSGFLGCSDAYRDSCL